MTDLSSAYRRGRTNARAALARQRIENDKLRALNAAMLTALRAHHAWAYCEHHLLGSFDARGTLCAHASYLTAKALALADGRDFDQEYKGRKSLIVWPQVRLDETDEATGEALVAEALEHERAALAEAREGERP